MSGSVRDFFDDVGDDVSDAIDDAATEIGDSADDVRDEVNDDDTNTSATNTNTQTTNTQTTTTTPNTNTQTTTTNTTTPGSTEANSPNAQVTRLYDAALDRAPDDAGLAFWTNALQSGTSLDAIADVFVASPEFQGRYGNLGAGEFVDRLYLNVLDREADAPGRAFWTNALQSGALDRGGVTLAFSESPENLAGGTATPSTDDPLV